jgi:hypothetical protein
MIGSGMQPNLKEIGGEGEGLGIREEGVGEGGDDIRSEGPESRSSDEIKGDDLRRGECHRSKAWARGNLKA